MIGTLVVKRLRFDFKAMQILILLNSDIDLLFLYELKIYRRDIVFICYRSVILIFIEIISTVHNRPFSHGQDFFQHQLISLLRLRKWIDSEKIMVLINYSLREVCQ